MAIVTGIRLDVDEALYQLLKETQQQFRFRTGRLISFAAIITHVVSSELNQNKQLAIQIAENFYETGIIPQGYHGKNKKYLKERQRLDEKEKEINLRESNLDEERRRFEIEKRQIAETFFIRHNEISEKNQQIFDMRMEYSDKLHEKERTITDLENKIKALEKELQRANRQPRL